MCVWVFLKNTLLSIDQHGGRSTRSWILMPTVSLCESVTASKARFSKMAMKRDSSLTQTILSETWEGQPWQWQVFHGQLVGGTLGLAHLLLVQLQQQFRDSGWICSQSETVDAKLRNHKLENILQRKTSTGPVFGWRWDRVLCDGSSQGRQLKEGAWLDQTKRTNRD